MPCSSCPPPLRTASSFNGRSDSCMCSTTPPVARAVRLARRSLSHDRTLNRARPARDSRGDRHAAAAPMTVDVPRRFAAELIGTAMLLAAVVGSGIMADRLSGGKDAIALLANTIATAAALAALILTFGPISGAHFTPAVSIADASQGGLRWQEVPAYVLAQLLDAVTGVLPAHVMFGEQRL